VAATELEKSEPELLVFVTAAAAASTLEVVVVVQADGVV
jgi:hypothetical protein